jgi:hypothetical protein
VKHLHRITAIALLALACLALASCARKDDFDWGRFVLFSAVSGKVLDKGRPVAGLTLMRTVEWKGDTYTDTAVTGKEGEFAFPVFKKLQILRQVLPDEPNIGQTIATVFQGRKYEIWSVTKPNYDNNSELFYVDFDAPFDPSKGRGKMISDPGKVPITLTCDLATDVRKKPDGSPDWDWFKSRGPKGRLSEYCLVD